MLGQHHHIFVQREASGLEFGDEFRLTQETLGPSRELSEHERLAGNRRGFRRQRISGEGENEKSRASFADSRRLAQAAPELSAGAGEVPDSVCDHDIAGSVGHGKVVHCRLREGETSAHSPGPRYRRLKHGHGEVESDDIEAQFREGMRIATGATADIEDLPGATPAALCLGETDQGGIGRRL